LRPVSAFECDQMYCSLENSTSYYYLKKTKSQIRKKLVFAFGRLSLNRTRNSIVSKIKRFVVPANECANVCAVVTYCNLPLHLRFVRVQEKVSLHKLEHRRVSDTFLFILLFLVSQPYPYFPPHIPASLLRRHQGVQCVNSSRGDGELSS
jgi:hypothetical protein